MFYIDWVGLDSPVPQIPPEGYPFRLNVTRADLPRHKMNLLFALCGHADALRESGHAADARQLLFEAALLEPEAGLCGIESICCCEIRGSISAHRNPKDRNHYWLDSYNVESDERR